MGYQFPVKNEKENKKNFMRKKLLFLIATAVLLLGFISLGFIYNGRGQAAAEKDESLLVVEVQKGDTIWGIAKNHKEPGKDIRSLVFEIRKINSLDDACIYPGQELIIPK
ncbi:LysM peptidoglycan-binding domain-containing protein [Candidatus Contubernalis alkaliaceticus]|uniref:LysM peptidoglycan-binding domain-containing protein n=1 Tax=Candidatus Contubernalis alkaliaceticus TaxID=338645 RepID=UPI001F4C16CA|nr:LysM peptidoglycan-binding domain-containing protein [Candidatus Contubernalis alkalaceticus]UNC91904.1 LysM peptidoglycan-binding domain-containing protein [Candidatus Contubernalis alkalaceticus]